MLSAVEVSALVGAQHPDPFAVLGMHSDAKGALWVRALLPGAAEVAVHDASTGRLVSTIAARDAEGLFEGAIPRRRKRFDYRLHVRWASGISGV